MGGKRIAEQVRRALVAAAKTAPVVVAIDASGCNIEPQTVDTCAALLPPVCAAQDASADASKDGG